MKFYLYIIAFMSIGCQTTSKYEYNASIVGADYCQCMSVRNPQKDSNVYWYAKKVCDGLMTKKYYFFRLMEVDSKLPPFEASAALVDSLLAFQIGFEKTVKQTCCQTVRNCKPDEKRPSMPAIGL
jgi:hypothetical protein